MRRGLGNGNGSENKVDILVTAFTPFGGMEKNMSSAVMNCLPDEIGDIRLHKLLIPTSYDRGFEELHHYLNEHRVDAVVLTGQAGRPGITVERVAVNVGDASIADNDGIVYTDRTLVPDGPAAYFSTLPIKRMCAAADCSVSNSAGTYACNCVMYKALNFLDGTGIPCGFVHIPASGSAEGWAEELVKMIKCLDENNV